MNSRSKSRIIGAFLVGFLTVAGAYAINAVNGKTTTAQAEPTVGEAPLRVAIEVGDSNDDGIEDWREEFLKAPAITTKISTSTDGDYVPPSTLTGQVAISLMKRSIYSKTNGAFGDSQENIISTTVSDLDKLAGDKIYGIRDIITAKDSSDETIRNYANSMALAITENNVPDLRDKFLILREVLNSENPKEEDLEELRVIAEIYLNTKNSTLNIPVPKVFIKEHLDLINVYHALYVDINAMAKVHEDPLFSLLRLKRYEEDIQGLSLALQNMYISLEKYSKLFGEDDPAVLFGIFSPNFNRQ